MRALFKVLLFVLPALLITQCEWFGEEVPDPNDIVNIPDQAFLNALINEGVDTNEDRLISYTEAEAVDSLYIGWAGKIDDGGECMFIDVWGYPKYEGIGSLEGIGAFKNLRYLDCSYNIIGSLDLHNNNALRVVICHVTGLDSLNITGCSSLTHLECRYNHLTSLDLSQNIELEYLNPGYPTISGNQGGSAWRNQFTSLDLSANIKLKSITLTDLPTLTKICVWAMPFPPAGVMVEISGSPNVYFTTECSK